MAKKLKLANAGRKIKRIPAFVDDKDERQGLVQPEKEVMEDRQAQDRGMIIWLNSKGYTRFRLGDAYAATRNNRVPRAIKILKAFAARHMKAEDEQRVVISEALNKHIWERSIQRPPRRVKVRLVKDDEAVRAYLADEKVEEKKKARTPRRREGEEKKAEGHPREKPEPKEQKAEHKPPSPAAEAKKEKK